MIEVFSSSRGFKPLQNKARHTVIRTLRLLRQKGSVSIWLLSDPQMRALNRRFKGKDIPANVLSFSNPKGFVHPSAKNKEKILGEIYLAPDFIKKRGENLDLMVIHGLLHLLGYDHETKSDRIKMEKIERKVLSKISNF